MSQEQSRKKSPPRSPEIQTWLVARVAKLLEIDGAQIDVDAPMDEFGLDSAAVVGLTGDLEDWLERDVSPVVAYRYPTIHRLADHLAK